MGNRQYSNFPTTVAASSPFATLGSSALVGDTSLTLTTGHGARFASPSGSQFQLATCTRASDNAIEIVKVTSRTGDVLTVTRAQEGSSALALASGDRVEPGLTSGIMAQLPQMDSAETIAGPFTFSDGGAKANGVTQLGQTAALSDPASTDIKQFVKIITSKAPLSLPFQRDGLGSTSRVPEQPYQLANWPTGGSWHLTEYDIGQGVRGFGSHCMNTPYRASQSATAMAAGSFRGEAAPRITLTTMAGANSGAGFSQDVNTSVASSRSYWRGNAAGRGGFLVSMLFDLTTISTSTGRFFAGLTNNTTAQFNAAADVANADQCIGLGFNDGDTNMTILCSDGTTLAKVPLDTTRTKTQANGNMYWVLLAASPNASGIWAYVVEFTSSSYAGTVLMDETLTQNGTVNAVTTKIPGNATFMRQHCGLSTGTGTGALTLGFVSGLSWSPR